MNMTIKSEIPRIRRERSSADAQHMGEDKTPEYSVYIYHQTFDGLPEQWEKKHSTAYVDQAIKRAKILYRSDKYSKVEVKKIELDERKQKTVETSCKVYATSAWDRYLMRMNIVLINVRCYSAWSLGFRRFFISINLI